MKTDNIKQWLASSQRNVPYELDFFTPFKDMVPNAAVQHGNKDAGKRKHDPASPQAGRSHISISSESSDTSTTSSDSSYKYKKRPRHKTREDLYEYKGGRPPASKPHRKSSKRESKQGPKEESKRRKKHENRAKKDVADKFHAKNVSADRLTFNHASGLFRQGKASAPIRKAGPPDLAFSERAFLKLRNDYQAQQEVELEDAVRTSKEAGRRKDRQQEQDAKISEYFRQPLHGRGANVPITVEERLGSNFNRPIVYETPCHQRQPSPGMSSTVLANLPLPGPPYLGFGERGPAPVPRTSLRRSHSHPPVSEPPTHPILPTRTEMESVGDVPSSDKAESQDAATTFAADPRALHSPTSNFNFAKLQDERHRKLKKTEHKQTSLSDAHKGKRQDEILELLRDLKYRRKDVAVNTSAQSGQAIGQQDLGKTVKHVDNSSDEALGSTVAEALQQVEETVDQRQILRTLTSMLDLLKRRELSSKDNRTQPEDGSIARLSAVSNSADQVQQQGYELFEPLGNTAPIGIDGIAIEPDDGSKCDLQSIINKHNTDDRDENNGGTQDQVKPIADIQETQDQQALNHGAILEFENNQHGGHFSALESLPFVGSLRRNTVSASVRPASQGPVSRSMFSMPSIYELQARGAREDGFRRDFSMISPPMSSTPGLRYVPRAQSPWCQQTDTSQQTRLDPVTQQNRVAGFGEALPRPNLYVHSPVSPSLRSGSPCVRQRSLPDQDELEDESMADREDHTVDNDDESLKAINTYAHLEDQGGRFSRQSLRTPCARVSRPMPLLPDHVTRGPSAQERTHSMDGFWRPNVLY